MQPSERAPGLLLGEDVRIGEGVRFGAYVVVHDGTDFLRFAALGKIVR